MINPNFDFQLKMTCLQIAAKEILDYTNTRKDGKVELRDLFNRAEKLYEQAYIHKIMEWIPPFEDEKPKEIKARPEPPKQPEAPKQPEDIAKQFKTCPKCNELVPMLWKNHVAKSSGEKCGHVF